jgi:hypothetical protein
MPKKDIPGDFLRFVAISAQLFETFN